MILLIDLLSVVWIQIATTEGEDSICLHWRVWKRTIPESKEAEAILQEKEEAEG